MQSLRHLTLDTVFAAATDPADGMKSFVSLQSEGEDPYDPATASNRCVLGFLRATSALLETAMALIRSMTGCTC